MFSYFHIHETIYKHNIRTYITSLSRIHIPQEPIQSQILDA
jgi:hypothetical protein